MAEKSINEVSRDARLSFVKANEAAQRENLDYAIALFNQVLEKEPGFFDCRKALRAAQFQKSGGPRRVLQKNVERRRLLAAGRQGQNGLEQKSRRGHGHCRADFERRPEQLRRAPDHRGRGARPGIAAHRRLVPRNPVEQFSEGQGSGDRICPRARRRATSGGRAQPRRKNS